MKPQEIQTKQLILRKIDLNLLDYLHNQASDEELRSVLGLETQKQYEDEKSRYRNGRWSFNKHLLYFQLYLKDQPKVIGWCGFHTWYLDHDRAELGYELYSEDHRAKGLMKEALADVLHYGYKQMNLHRVEAMVSPNNNPSLKLLQGFGFKKEGHLREHYLRDGIWEDSLVFSLLSKEYEP